MEKRYLHILLCLPFFWGCSTEEPGVSEVEQPPLDNDPNAVTLYFPPSQSVEWETTSPETLGWNTTMEDDLKTYLEDRGTKAFLIVKDGRLVSEWYFGDHGQNTNWYWASAGKTLTAFTVGIAQEAGFLNIDDRTSDYLGTGWTSADLEKENLITITNQLTMTAGLNDIQFDCKTPDCLQYVADAGTRWAYHNGPYTLLQDVVANATETEWSSYFNTNVRDRIGMDGFWFSANGLNNVYFSTARSMARFGLLNLNRGVWDGTAILESEAYHDQMTNTSQQLNQSYGFLWWLNGKSSHRLPSTQLEFNGALVPNAPADMYSGLGRDDQKLYIVPSENLVVVRMGEDAGESSFALSSFDNDLWALLNDFMD